MADGPQDASAAPNQSVKNLKAVLEHAGASLEDVVQTTVWLRDLGDFGGMRETVRQWFTDGYPARMTATTDFLDPRCLVMIEAVAHRPS